MLEAVSETPNSLRVVPVWMKDAAAEQSHLFTWHIWHSVCQRAPSGYSPFPAMVWGRDSQEGFAWSGAGTHVNFVWCQAGTHRQVLSGMLGQAGVLRLCFPTLFRGKPRPGQPQTPPPGARALLVRREASTSGGYAHPSSRPALPNGAPHLPS